RKIVIRNPLDALRKLAICLDEFFDGLPSSRVGHKESDRQEIAIEAADPIAQAAHIALGGEPHLVAAAQFRIKEQHSEVGIAPHHEFDVDAALAKPQVLGAVCAFAPEGCAVTSLLKEPTLRCRGEEIAFQLLWIWPFVMMMWAEMDALFHIFLTSTIGHCA